MAMYSNPYNPIVFDNETGFRIIDDTLMKDFLEAEILTNVLELRSPDNEPIGFTATIDLINEYIDRYNRAHKTGCRTIDDIVEFEIMRIRAGHEYSLGEI
jgi:hypothetical protein